jgi:hypothetical protein
MSRWFRHYAGLCRDDKLVSAAIKAKQPVERVVWVWCAILESAAEIDDNGRYELDCAEVAYFLRADEDHIHSVENALGDMGRVSDGSVVKWGNRQFSSDRSKERVAAHRERKRTEKRGDALGEPSRNDDVTLQERHCNSPETELETDIQLAEANCPAEPAPKPAVSLVDQLWTDGILTLETMHVVTPKARSMVGKWLKDTGSDAGRVLWAINEASIHGSGDPIPYIARVLSDRSTEQRAPPRQARRNTALDELNDIADRMFGNVQQFPRIAG